MLPKLNQEVKTFIFQCLDESPPVKAELAKHASGEFFVIRVHLSCFFEGIIRSVLSYFTQL